MAGRERHITLKEAAAISGYTPDYLGQLIRKGKLTGTQVYSHVSWVTTEEAILDYLEKTTGKQISSSRVNLGGVPWETIIKIVSISAIAIASVLILLSFYVFSALSDRQFSEKVRERVVLEPKVENIAMQDGESLGLR
jgi:predicted membrane protein